MENTIIFAFIISLPFWVVAVGFWTGGILIGTAPNEPELTLENVVLEPYEITDKQEKCRRILLLEEKPTTKVYYDEIK